MGDPADTLETRLSTMKQEIDALQIAAADQIKPWYRQASVMIAVLALVFSFGTTFYSEQRTRQQDVHNAKVELRELIQRLTQMPERNIGLSRKYEGRPQFELQAASSLNTENIVLSKQALDLIDEIPDEVTATEYHAVASALAFAGDYGQTIQLYERALDVADDANDWVAATRSLASSAFRLGDVERGRASFRRALETFDRFPTRNRYYRMSTDAYTHTLWAQSEINSGQCAEGRKHIGVAEAGLGKLPEEGAQTRYAGQLTTVRQQAERRCGAT